MDPRTMPQDVAGARDTRSPATRTCVATIGLVVAFAALEHGIGEILQGSRPAPGLVFESWPDSAAFAVLDGEPAMSVIPDLLVAGIATSLLAVGFAWTALRVARIRHGGLLLVGLSLVLLLAGGGLAPPVIGVVLGAAWLGAQHPRRASRPGPLASSFGRFWRPLLVLTVVAYLGLFPGTVLLYLMTGTASELLVTALGLTAFVGLVASLVAARAADRVPVPVTR